MKDIDNKHLTSAHPDGNTGPAREILLVEDTDAHAEVVRLAFEEKEGPFRLTTVSTLEQAQAALRSGSFALVICDWHLPDGKGIELLTRCSQDLPFPVLMMTAQ